MTENRRNPERRRALQAGAARRRYAANPEKRRTYQRAWRAANPAKQAEYDARWYATHQAVSLERHRQWVASHPERASELYSANQHRRRAQMRGSGLVSIREVFERDGGICHLCGGPVDWDTPPRHRLSKTRDHVIPLSCGGAHELANVRLAHYSCNSARKARLLVAA